MSDSLERAVDARDRRMSRAKDLERAPRRRVDRRICSTCWHVVMPKPGLPDVEQCPKCGGQLAEVRM